MQNYNVRYGQRMQNQNSQMMQENHRPIPTPRMAMVDSTCQHVPTSCRIPRDMLENMPLAMAYVPWQNWQDIYEVHKGIHRGTIFEELDKPFFGRGGCNR